MGTASRSNVADASSLVLALVSTSKVASPTPTGSEKTSMLTSHCVAASSIGIFKSAVVSFTRVTESAAQSL